METKYSSFIIVVFSLVSLMTDQVRFGLKNVGPTSPFCFYLLEAKSAILRHYWVQDPSCNACEQRMSSREIA